jgi:hypothetical protein
MLLPFMLTQLANNRREKLEYCWKNEVEKSFLAKVIGGEYNQVKER